jgi:hypothetical protein
VDDGAPPARIAAGWANHVKTAEPMAFLRSVYDHLPPELAVLRRRRRGELSREALHLAGAASNDDRTTRALALEAVSLAPRLFFNRGVLSMLFWPSRERREGKPAPGGSPSDRTGDPIVGELVD